MVVLDHKTVVLEVLVVHMLEVHMEEVMVVARKVVVAEVHKQAEVVAVRNFVFAFHD